MPRSPAEQHFDAQRQSVEVWLRKNGFALGRIGAADPAGLPFGIPILPHRIPEKGRSHAIVLGPLDVMVCTNVRGPRGWSGWSTLSTARYRGDDGGAQLLAVLRSLVAPPLSITPLPDP